MSKKKKKILLLSDDLRMHSGVATVSREIVLGTAKHFDWVQIAGSIKHPDKGKIFDLSQAANEKLKINDAYIKLYAVDGYGGPDVVRQLINVEKPDAILHFTDPRFWIWLYQMEREIRKFIPLCYLNIWDDVPYPMYNKSYYESCDLLMAISKQTENINKNVLGDGNYSTLNDLNYGNDFKRLIHYVPHGINSETFFPITKDDEENYAKLVLRKTELFKDKKYEFVVYYNNRNIRRKQTTDVVIAYKHFVESLPKEKRDKVCLLMHTQPKDDNGTDLLAVKEALCPDYDIIFSLGRIEPEKMNLNYNIADVTINIASNEGFGLGTAESIMAGTPIVVNVTGGLQDQCGFVDENGEPIKFSKDWASNHDGRYKTHGKWVKPVFPSSRSVQGSIPTPYISDDRVKIEDASKALMFWYLAGEEKRRECGLAGREWAKTEGGLNSENMCNQLIKSFEVTFENWQKRTPFDLIKTVDKIKHVSGGFGLAELDIEEIKKELETL